MTLAPERTYTPEEYLALERRTEEKHEYLHGHVYAMGGATQRHSLIVANLVRELSLQFKDKTCWVYPADMRVQVAGNGLYTYPDVVALCGEPRFLDATEDTLLNPALIVEVLSKSTESYDRGEKFAHYRELGSLEEYVLVAQDRVSVERFLRQPDGQWLLAGFRDLGDTVTLASVGCQLALVEVYDKVRLPEE